MLHSYIFNHLQVVRSPLKNDHVNIKYNTKGKVIKTQKWKVVAIFQVEFRSGTLSNKSTWKTVVFIPKGYGREFQGIGLVDLL